MFFQRIDFDYSDIVVGAGNTPILERALAELANRFNMTWKISYKNKVGWVSVAVSVCVWGGGAEGQSELM